MLNAIKFFVICLVTGVLIGLAGLYFKIPMLMNVSYHSKEGQEIARKISSKIVEEFYAGGRNITCDSIDAQWGGKVRAKISWHGAFNEYATYWVEGEITPPAKESRGRWRPTSASQSLRELFPSALDERIIDNK